MVTDSSGEIGNVVIMEASSPDSSVEPIYNWGKWSDVLEQMRKHGYVKSLTQMIEQTVNQAMGLDSASQSRPWYLLGFHDRICAVIRKAVNKGGFVLSGSLEQHQATQYSSVYTVPIEGGRLFFKQCPLNSGESRRTLAINKIFPKYTDTFVEIDTTLETILMHEHGPSPSSRADFEKGLQQWAMIQQESIHHMDELKAGAIPVRDEHWLHEGLDSITQYLTTHGLIDDQMRLNVSLGHKHLEETGRSWEESGIPNTLVHGRPAR